MLVIGPVHLERDSSVDSYSVLENDTRLGERARLCGQSALAAGRKIPDDETWDGAPARRRESAARKTAAAPATLASAGAGRRWLFFAATAIVVSVLFFLPAFPGLHAD